MIREFDDCLKLAKEYLAHKQRDNYYDFEVLDEEYPEYVHYLNSLSDEEVEKIRQLKKKYPEDYCQHLVEVFEDPDVVHDLSCGQEIISIDTETISHKYRFVSHEVSDEKWKTRKIQITLSDDDYARLLAWHLFDDHLIINTLYYRDEALYKKIQREVDWAHSDDGWFIPYSNPYIVTMDEANEDADQIRKLNGIEKSSGYMGIFF